MERRLLERLIGAVVLVMALVIVVPAILDGDSGDTGLTGDRSESGDPARMTPPISEPRRTHTIRLDQQRQAPPVARSVTEANAVPAPESKEPLAVSKPKPEKPSTVQTQPPEPVLTDSKPPQKTDSTSVQSVQLQEAGWVVQLGSFSSEQNARHLADEVSSHGFPVFLTPLERSGKTLYRVRVGPQKTREQAMELAGRLKKAGYTGQVTR